MTGSVSPRRADTRRNHERILAVAAQTLAATGEVSFNAIAKRAGVGVGTVYRHFPAPADLILAVYEREVRQLVDVVPELLEHAGPAGAFRTWTAGHLARYMITKCGLAKALAAATAERGTLPGGGVTSIGSAMDALLRANAEAGLVRPDVTAETVMRGLMGLLYLDPDGDWEGQAAELVELVWRGIRAG
ncbi:TetR/AcrR family transcriptional regulator [Amycolatopsis endophytica]|uniref:AcrR family transcriptional regulator n=1 Tax=Amycolatopsis endophytica TaxID=860233 RepID=A0A853B9R0_9PSEU|nr:TetR/AcrR family transcriptional regulator [Amycolatopsis endophytica]NYI91502.1 AcrR family transcriptional regulator [Amycolatopsis endophytica]